MFIITPSSNLCYDVLIIVKFSDRLLYIKEDRLPSKSVHSTHASLLNQNEKPILGLNISNIDV